MGKVSHAVKTSPAQEGKREKKKSKKKLEKKNGKILFPACLFTTFYRRKHTDKCLLQQH